MLISCWSVKGGSGATVVAAALACSLARRHRGGALLADIGGDAAAALGVPDPPGPGLTDWSAAGERVPLDALGRLETSVTPELGLLHRGAGPVRPERAAALASALLADPRPVVADCGTVGPGMPGADEPGARLAAASPRSLLVLRPCYLALRRALDAPVDADAVVLVSEPGRPLGRADVEVVLGIPVVGEVAVDPAVARAVDAGLLAARLPRGLMRAVERLVGALGT